MGRKYSTSSDSNISGINSIVSNFDFCKDPIELYPLSFLQSRYEKKYITSRDQFISLINNKKIQNAYSIGFNSKFTKYNNQYYDLENYYLYIIHHNGKKNRFKIRTRYYENSKGTFELNYKNNRNLMTKNRFPLLEGENPLLKYGKEISSITKYNSNLLYESLKTQYYRITLFNRNSPERVTIDTNLIFSGEVEKRLNDIFIIEIKTDFYSNRSVFNNILKEMKIQSIPFSKYCIGISLTNSKIKKNNFKPIMNRINKIMEN